MNGIFKGWINEYEHGYIKPEDGSTDIIVYKNSVQTPEQFERGMNVTFDIKTSEKGRKAVNLAKIAEASISKNKIRGRVKFWNDTGYGMIEQNTAGKDVIFYSKSLHSSENEHLTEGCIVEFDCCETAKGLEATNVSVVGWEKTSDPLSAFADLGKPGWVQKLKSLAEDEPWDYKNIKSPEPLPILRSYIRHTFRRLEEMKGGIGYSKDGKYSAFNTGLVTPNQEEIYAMFVRNAKIERQPWMLYGFKKISDSIFVDNFGSSPPPLAEYFNDPSVLLFDRRCQIYINIEHVMEHIERFPTHLQGNPYVARQLLISAEATTKKRVYRNYKAAIPQFFRDKGKQGSVQLLLPICLENPGKADLALVAEKSETADAYRCSTILTLDMAYNNARLLARPDTEWLQP